MAKIFAIKDVAKGTFKEIGNALNTISLEYANDCTLELTGEESFARKNGNNCVSFGGARSGTFTVNTEMIYMYWNIGKIISENIEWGNKFVDNLSIDLKNEFPNIQGFSVRNLRNMRKFYEEYPSIEILQTLSAKLTWSHNILLINKIKDMEIRKWYMKETIKNGWSHDVLADQIKYKLYERQAIAEKVTNFENTLPDVQSDLAMQTMKDPYIFDFIVLKGQVKEKQIEDAMIEKIKNVLIELGNGFAFVGNQYKITVSDTDYFIDYSDSHIIPIF